MRNLVSDTNFDFMGRDRLAVAVSGTLLVVAVLAILVRGLAFGVDFTGGYAIQVGYSDAPDLNAVRSTLAEAGFDDAQVQTFGTSRDVMIRMPPVAGLEGGEASAQVSDEVFRVLEPTAGDGTREIRSIEFVGPQVGEELREKGGLAVLSALFGIIVYIWFRFEKKFAIGSVVALVHDVTITVGVFALLRLDFDLTVLAACLAVIGYSLNDTIVVFDRIRENFLPMRSGTPAEVMNTSINQTLTRTVITSGTTLLVLLSLFLFGGAIIKGFATALLIGIVVGTYSSIFVASLIVLRMGVTREDLMPVEKEGADLDAIP